MAFSSRYLAGNQLLGMEELAISAGAHFVDDGGLQIDENGPNEEGL